jgi:outer membrane protein OmpA-like peptidoglycan-associated protein
LTFLVCGTLQASDLAFPKTEQEIVEALSLKDGQTDYGGVTYVSQNGKVYKVVRGKRFRLRGFDEIVDSDLPPKAGAIIEFEYGRDVIHPKFYQLLNEFGKALSSGLSAANIVVAGHTCDRGSDEYNLSLSERRAQAVKNYLETNYQIAPDRLAIKGYGKTRPIASNESETGRKLNRRVEFIRTDAP